MAETSEAAGQVADQPDLRDIQGNIVGFNKDHQRLVFLQFADAPTGKAFLATLAPRVSSANEVRCFNRLFKEIHGRAGEEGIVEATWLNIGLSGAGLREIGAPSLETFPGDFAGGMAEQAAQLGDVDDSTPSGWRPPFNDPAVVHAIVIIAADALEDLETRYSHVQQLAADHSVTELGHEDGNVRPDANRGHEHFGFKDGISQPGIRGLTTSSKTGQDSIATGEFLIGYPDESGAISGQAPAGLPPAPGQPGYNPTPPPPQPAPLPAWTHNGSFLVYRRLRQDVGAFNAFVAQKATELAMDPELLAAKLVGRWRSGAPMEHVPGLPDAIDPASQDPAPAHPEVLDDGKINNFDYEPGDTDGHAVPRAAHIRKVNPRSSNPNGGRDDTKRHRILRRGITYGPEFRPEETPYNAGPVTDDRDRGLLFLCYQASIAKGFAFIQQTWANNRDFPQAGDGEDPIICQALAEREFNLPPQAVHLLMARWVFTTAGEYFFVPSISALSQLGS